MKELILNSVLTNLYHQGFLHCAVCSVLEAYLSRSKPTDSRGMILATACHDRCLMHACNNSTVGKPKIVSVATQHPVNGRKFISWNCFDSNCVQAEFETIRW